MPAAAEPPGLIAAVPAAGMLSFWPLRITEPSKPLALASACGETPYRAAMRVRFSPGRT